MLIVYGTRRKNKIVKEYGRMICPNCNHAEPMALVREKTKFHICYIPFAIWISRRFLFCSNCGIAEQMDKNRFKQLSAQ